MNIGDIIRDNDPRTGGRMLVIESFDGNHHVKARPITNSKQSAARRRSRIAVASIYADDKPRKTGFTLQSKH